jgi:hypothetical protein
LISSRERDDEKFLEDLKKEEITLERKARPIFFSQQLK